MTLSEFVACASLWTLAGLVLFVTCSVKLHVLSGDGDGPDVPVILAVAILLFWPLGVAFLAIILRDIRRMGPQCPEPLDPDEIWFPDSQAVVVKSAAKGTPEGREAIAER